MRWKDSELHLNRSHEEMNEFQQIMSERTRCKWRLKDYMMVIHLMGHIPQYSGTRVYINSKVEGPTC